jgi:transposase
MFSLNENLTYYLYPRYISMGKGIDSLCGLLLLEPGCNPCNGHVFLFFGKKKDTVKILRWDRDGFSLFQKRLESGTFELPRFEPSKGLCRLEWATFFMLMEGLPLHRAIARKRFKLPPE